MTIATRSCSAPWRWPETCILPASKPALLPQYRDGTQRMPRCQHPCELQGQSVREKLRKAHDDALSWSPTSDGNAAMHLGVQSGPRAALRRAAGLAVLPDDHDRRDAMAQRVHEALAHGYAPSTRKNDEGY